MSQKVIRHVSLRRIWDIEGYSEYFFADDKNLYRYDSRGAIRQNKRIVIGYTTGYVLKSKFFSEAKLRPLLRRHIPATGRQADS